MLILGLNFSLDSAASLVGDGRLLASAPEERFDRVKHTRSFPSGALDFCLRSQGIDDIRDLDAVAFFWNAGTHLERFDVRQSGQWRHHSEFLTILPNYLLSLIPGGRRAPEVEYTRQQFVFREGAPDRKPLEIYYLDHHQCHAASCFYVSPFEEAAILTMDGYGERTAALMAHGQGTEIAPLKRIEFPHSLGAFYAALTQYLGCRANCDEGKVMALAALGEPTSLNEMRGLLRPTEDGGIETDLKYFAYYQHSPRRYTQEFERVFGPERQPDEEFSDRHRDVAASGQAVLEEAIIHLVRWVGRQTGTKRLCLAGGVALNSVANARLMEETDFEELFVQPAAGDDGASFGAALQLYHGILGKPREFVMDHAYWGPGFSDEEIQGALRDAKITAEIPADLPRATAALLAEGKFVGWFQGRMEMGPRALGARSILADPRGEDTRDRLNVEVKRRESFRPYAPAVLEERCHDYFDPGEPTPFMLRVQKARPEKAATIPAVVHADGTARTQTVGARASPRFRQLIVEFEKLTGVPMVLNTSFNVRGEPIVCSPSDAIRCFYHTGLDALAIGKFLVTK